jgi:hypothetical protein
MNPIKLLDGTWTPYYTIDPSKLLGLEAITLLLEFIVLLVFNLNLRRRKQWSLLEVLGATFFTNLFSFGVCFILILLRLL